MGLFDIFKVGQIKAENESLKQQLFLLQNNNQILNQQLLSTQQQLNAVQNGYNELTSRIDGTKQAMLQQEINNLNSLRNTAQEELDELRHIIESEQKESKSKLQAAQIKLTAANNALKAIQKVIKIDCSCRTIQTV